MGAVIDRLISRCVKDFAATGLVITNDRVSAMKIDHRIVMVYQGQIVWEGPREATQNSGNSFVEQLVEGKVAGPIQAEVFSG